MKNRQAPTKQAKNKASKPPKSQRAGTRIWDTMEQCSAATGIPKSKLAQAKALGCPAFNHGRVHEVLLLPWLEANKSKLDAVEPTSLAGAKLALVLEQVRRLKIANDVKEHRLAPVDQVIGYVVEFSTRAKSVLDQKLLNEMPTAVAGLQPPEARVLGKRYNDEILDGLRAAIQEMRAKFQVTEQPTTETK